MMVFVTVTAKSYKNLQKYYGTTGISVQPNLDLRLVVSEIGYYYTPVCDLNFSLMEINPLSVRTTYFRLKNLKTSFVVELKDADSDTNTSHQRQST